MKNTVPSITEMGIMEMLSAVFAGQIFVNSGSPEKRQDKETRRGFITSIVSRRLFTANCTMCDHMQELMKAHDRLHDEESNLSSHDCRAYRKNLTMLSNRRDVLHSLLWLSVAEEHHEVAANSACIKEGWALFDADGEWNGIDVFPDKADNIAAGFVARVSDILDGRNLKINEDGLYPVERGEEVIGIVEDPRIRSCRSLVTEIRQELESAIPPGMMDDDSEVTGNMKVKDLKRLRAYAMHLKNLVKVASDLFWCGVRDTVPAAKAGSNIGVRTAWEVVKRKNDEGGEDPKIVMTPDGPALAVQMPEELLEFLMGRKSEL